MPTTPENPFRFANLPSPSASVMREIERMVDEVVARQRDIENDLTRRQLVTAFAQALASGDFIRYVHGDSQCVTYEPFREVFSLRARIKELEADLAKVQQLNIDATRQWSVDVTALRARVAELEAELAEQLDSDKL